MVNLRQASEGPVTSDSYTLGVPRFSLPHLNTTNIVRPVGEPLEFATSLDGFEEDHEGDTDETENNTHDCTDFSERNHTSGGLRSNATPVRGFVHSCKYTYSKKLQV